MIHFLSIPLPQFKYINSAKQQLPLLYLCNWSLTNMKDFTLVSTEFYHVHFKFSMPSWSVSGYSERVASVYSYLY